MKLAKMSEIRPSVVLVIMSARSAIAAARTASAKRTELVDDRERVVREHRASNVKGERFLSDYRIRAKDGREVWIRDEAVPVQAEDGTHPIGVPRASMRLLGYILSGALFGIGFLMIALGGSALHDRLAGTRVMRWRRT